MIGIICKDHKMIDTRFERFTLYERRILLKLLVLISPDDKIFKEHKFNIKEFAKEFEFEINYHELKYSILRLAQRTFEIKRRRTWEVFTYLSYGKIVENEGIFCVKLNPLLSPYLLGLKERFKNGIGKVTIYHVKYAAGLIRSHSWKLYELLKKHERINSRTILIIELLHHLGIKDNRSYEWYGSLKQSILKPCINEINEKTDINVSFEEVKHGRKVVKIKFNIRKNSKIIERKKEKKKPKESDGQTFEEDGRLYTEREFINEFMIELKKAELQASHDRKIDASREYKVNTIKKAIQLQGFEFLYRAYCDKICKKDVDHINYFHYFGTICKGKNDNIN